MPNLNSVMASDTVDSVMEDLDTEDSEVTTEVSEAISENDRPMPNLNSDSVDSGMVALDMEDSEVTTEASEDITENDLPKLTSSVLDLFALMFLPHQQSNFVKKKKIKNQN
jgi:hypothetical protein